MAASASSVPRPPGRRPSDGRSGSQGAHSSSRVTGFASPDGPQAAVMLQFPHASATSVSDINAGASSLAGTSLSSAWFQKPGTAPSRQRPPVPPVPRLQPTAAEERHRSYLSTPRDSARPTTTPAAGGGLSKAQRGAEAAAAAAAAAAASKPKTPAHPLFPVGIMDPDDRVAVPDYRANTRWFSDTSAQKHTVLGPQLRPNAAASMVSPRTARNTAAKKHALDDVAEMLHGTIPHNLQAIVHTFIAQLPRLQSTDFTCAAFTRALEDLDVSDVLLAETVFNRLDVHKTGRVPLTTIMHIFDICLNNETQKRKVRNHCFELFRNSGVIHMTDLEEWRKISGKSNDFRAIGATADMVRVLGDVFIAARKEEEERYITDVLLKKKKGKKKKAPALKANQKSHVPPSMARISHLDFDLFSRYFDLNKELAAAFTPRWLRFMITDSELSHACVMRALRLAEDAEADATKEADES